MAGIASLLACFFISHYLAAARLWQVCIDGHRAGLSFILSIFFGASTEGRSGCVKAIHHE
eukprot:6192637-Pleurochrysis_carterae.AAC.2